MSRTKEKFKIIILILLFSTVSQAENIQYTIEWKNPTQRTGGATLASEFIEDTHIYIRYWPGDWLYYGSTSKQGGHEKYYININNASVVCFGVQTQTSDELVSDISEAVCVLEACH